jgi:hypothetical protein
LDGGSPRAAHLTMMMGRVFDLPHKPNASC